MMGKHVARWHNGAESREMARANGWVMVRRPGCAPYTIGEREWDALPSAEDGRRWHEEYRAAATLAKEGKE